MNLYKLSATKYEPSGLGCLSSENKLISGFVVLDKLKISPTGQTLTFNFEPKSLYCLEIVFIILMSELYAHVINKIGSAPDSFTISQKLVPYVLKSSNLFILCSVIMIIVSYLTKEPDYEKIKDLVYSKSALQTEEVKNGIETDKVLTVLIIISVFVIWYVFR